MIAVPAGFMRFAGEYGPDDGIPALGIPSTIAPVLIVFICF